MINKLMTDRARILAQEILDLSRSTVVVKFRFMDSAFFELKFQEYEKEGVSTNGKYFFYNYKDILNIYRMDRYAINRAFLHTVLHCIFLHPFLKKKPNIPIWNLSSDIAVENIINGFEYKDIIIDKRNDQEKYIQELKKELKVLTAEKVYYYLNAKAIKENELKVLQDLFHQDSHLNWYNGDSDGSFSITGEDFQNDIAYNKWHYISERIKLNEELFPKQYGTLSGDFSINMKEVFKEQYNYTDILKKFAVWDPYFETADESLFSQYKIDNNAIDKFADDVVKNVNDISIQLFEHA
jgi:hypothetical protein